MTRSGNRPLAIRWAVFIHERFPPLMHFPVIILMVMSLAKVAGQILFVHSIPVLLITISFFFRLRLFDEIKDFAFDVKNNKNRPLPRGLLSKNDVHVVLIALVAFELLVSFFLFPRALLALIITQLYSLLMFREFFMGNILRPRLTLYAVMHTFVVVPLSISILGMLTHEYSDRLTVEQGVYALGCWCIFNVFEFARKTFCTSEEKKGIDSYSHVWGRGGAIVLTMSQVVIGLTLFSWALKFSSVIIMFYGSVVVCLITSALWYYARDSKSSAKLYRLSFSLFLVLAFMWFFLY